MSGGGPWAWPQVKTLMLVSFRNGMNDASSMAFFNTQSAAWDLLLGRSEFDKGETQLLTLSL